MTNKMICRAKIPGMPNLKAACFVLWRKTAIPNMEPAEPPRAAIRKSVFSFMRHMPRFALRLSTPMEAKPNIFIMAR